MNHAESFLPVGGLPRVFANVFALAKTRSLNFRPLMP
jgi:hypothetical protein